MKDFVWCVEHSTCSPEGIDGYCVFRSYEGAKGYFLKRASDLDLVPDTNLMIPDSCNSLSIESDLEYIKLFKLEFSDR